MSIHVCTFFSPFAQSRHILSLSPDSSLAGQARPAAIVKGLYVRHQNKRNHSRSKKAALGSFFRDCASRINRQKEKLPFLAQTSSETRFGGGEAPAGKVKG